MGLQPDIIVAYTHNISDGGIRVHKLPRAGETVRALEGGLGIEGAKVDSIDATGAGDGFLGAMTARLAAGASLGEACRWANQYAAYTVQKSGTISSYPRLSELKLQR